MEPANITALANDVGAEVIFLRQLIAHGRPGDIAVGISTSGGSRNIIMALEEARKRRMLTVVCSVTTGEKSHGVDWLTSRSLCGAITFRAFRKCKLRSIT